MGSTFWIKEWRDPNTLWMAFGPEPAGTCWAVVDRILLSFDATRSFPRTLITRAVIPATWRRSANFSHRSRTIDIINEEPAYLWGRHGCSTHCALWKMYGLVSSEACKHPLRDWRNLHSSPFSVAPWLFCVDERSCKLREEENVVSSSIRLTENITAYSQKIRLYIFGIIRRSTVDKKNDQ